MQGTFTQETQADSTAIWSYNRRLTHRLATWSILSIVCGAAMRTGASPFWRALGLQSITWGAIDATIALAGQQGAERKQASATAAVEVAHAHHLRRVLWLNTGLDLLYILFGAWLMRGHSAQAVRASARRGHGAGVIIQGAFLLIFDLVHALRVPRVDKSSGVS